MATTNILPVGQDETIALTLGTSDDPTSQSTAGLTVKVYAVTLAGVEYEIGSTTGAAAGTPIVVSCDMSTAGLTVGETYTLHATGDPTGTPIRMLPNPNTAQRIYIKIVNQPGVS